MTRGSLILALVACALALASPAAAGDWYPHPASASWVYEWTDSVYAPTPTKEKVTVKEQKGSAFTLAWTTDELGNPDDAQASAGEMSFLETSGGLSVVDWQSTLAPSSFPILCSSAARCGNSLASALYNLAWGSRAPLLSEPLLQGASWTSTGGAANDVASSAEYAGVERVSVPAFPSPVLATKVRSEISQAGALGDPYGSGVRTTWWVYGVGPVKIVFEHAGGVGAPVTTVSLASTSLTPETAPTPVNYFPLRKGLKGTFSWTNTKYLKKPSVQSFNVDEVVNGSGRVSVKSVSGPIKVAAVYGFTARVDGVTNIWGLSRAASLAKLPNLGPKALPATKRRHFHTPFDLLTFGFNPVIPAYPSAGDSWTAATTGRDWSTYGVTGRTTIVGVQSVKVPAGTFRALVVRTTLKQAGFPFGSGTRTAWLAADRGLVKLEFRHGDGSTSLVELTKK